MIDASIGEQQQPRRAKAQLPLTLLSNARARPRLHKRRTSVVGVVGPEDQQQRQRKGRQREGHLRHGSSRMPTFDSDC